MYMNKNNGQIQWKIPQNLKTPNLKPLESKPPRIQNPQNRNCCIPGISEHPLWTFNATPCPTKLSGFQSI